jgi:hypothetical protein
MPQGQNSATDSENNVKILILRKTKMSESLKMDFQMPTLDSDLKLDDILERR